MPVENEHTRKRVAVFFILGLFVNFVVYFHCAIPAEADDLQVDIVSLDISDNGEAVAINKQEMLEISLQSDIINGYQWMLDATSLNPDVLAEVGAHDSNDKQAQYIRWLFRPKDSGFSSIILNYKNLSDNTVYEAFEVAVSVLADPNERPAPFSLVAHPNKMNHVIPGQKCVYLVKVIDEGSGFGKGEPVNLSAMNLSYNSKVTAEPNLILPGQVSEITIEPNERGNLNEINLDDSFEYEEGVVAVTAERNGVQREIYLYLNIYPGEDFLEPTASEYRDRFIPYLAANFPELGITEETVWKGTAVRPRYLVVSYYLFFSQQWEMGLRWHVMIPPYDWAEIYLRKRSKELSSTYAFRIPSVDSQDEPQVVDLPPEGIFR